MFFGVEEIAHGLPYKREGDLILTPSVHILKSGVIVHTFSSRAGEGRQEDSYTSPASSLANPGVSSK